MRKSQEEIDLAILTIIKDKEVAPEYNFFGDNNHKAMDISISVLRGDLDSDDIDQMVDDEEITYGEKDTIDSWIGWLEGDGEDISELVFDEDSIVTSKVEVIEPTSNINICSKLCGECPFSKNSPKGWLADYQPEDFAKFMHHEISFPCHLTTKENFTPEEANEAVAKGELKLCRGYVESIVKSCKMIHDNPTLNKAVEMVKAEGTSENSMAIWEFIKHHDAE